MVEESAGIVVVDEQEMECAWCEVTATIGARMKSFGTVFYTPVEEPGVSPSITIYETDVGKLCDECREAYRQRQRELREAPEVTVPKPPDEWRFCQGCGDKIAPTRLEGQLCDECE